MVASITMLAPRHLPRLTATVGLFTRYGLADFAREQGLSGLAKDEVERMGETFLKLGRRMAELAAAIGLKREDLDLRLGPIHDLS